MMQVKFHFSNLEYPEKNPPDWLQTETLDKIQTKIQIQLVDEVSFTAATYEFNYYYNYNYYNLKL